MKGTLMFTWRQVMIYGVFLVLAWLVFRVAVRKDYREKGRLSFWTVLLEFLVFAVHGNLSYLFLPVDWPGFPPLQPKPVQNTIAFGLMGIGFLSTLGAMFKLGFKKTLGQRETFYRGGLYRWSRNPQLISYAFLLAGYGMLFPSLRVLPWLGVYGITAHWMVQSEEEYLREAYGEVYQRYLEEVPRYLIFR
jgi:protein-S-isoprenylcysteine O-methyltransferase Ste14